MYPTASKPSVCFVSITSDQVRPILDASTRYRCFHVAEQLVADGHRCCVQTAWEFVARRTWDYDVYVFHRPTGTLPGLASAIKELKRRGKRVIADYDDLIFGDADTAEVSSIVKNGMLSLEAAVATFDDNAQTLRLFDDVTTSTHPLAARVLECNNHCRVRVVPNAIPDTMFALSDRLRLAESTRPSRHIGYFCGTATHKLDFPVLHKAIMRVLDEHQDSRLIVVGPIDLHEDLQNHPRCLRESHVRYQYLPSLMSRCRVCVAPLEDTVFNNCKSRVKFLEAGMAGCHLVASPIDDMRRVSDAWISLPKSAGDWHAAVSAALETDGAIDHAVENYEYLKRNCHARTSAQQLRELIDTASEEESTNSAA